MNWVILLGGCAGGALPDVIRIVRSRHQLTLPRYLRSVNFWIGFGLLLVLGIAAAWLGEAKEIKEALAYGFSAPEIISRLLSKSTADRGSISSIRNWWSV